MERIQGNLTLAVLARFVRRYWRLPLQLAGVVGFLLVLFVALPFLPRPAMRVEASDAPLRPSNTAVVESLRARGVGATFDGPVERVTVVQGQAVKKGDLLFRMDVSGLVGQIALAQGEVADARAAVAQAQQMRREDTQALTEQIASLKGEIARATSVTTITPVTFERTALDEDEALPVQPEQPAVDPARVPQLQAELGVAQQRLAEQDATWLPVLQDSRQRLAAAQAQILQLQGMIKGADRHSPIDGIVVRVDARAGQWLGNGATGVRVDDPQGFRVVALVDEKTRATLTNGKPLPLQGPQGPATGTVEKIVPGWDKELFYHWVWVKPANPAAYWPGQQVQLK